MRVHRTGAKPLILMVTVLMAIGRRPMRFRLAFTGLAPALVVLFASTAGHAQFPDRPTYADLCAAEMGTIPAFNCMEGAELKIAVDGHNTTKSVDKCDHPVQLD